MARQIPGLVSTSAPNIGRLGLGSSGRFNAYGDSSVQVLIDGFEIQSNTYPDWSSAQEIDIKSFGNSADIADSGCVWNLVSKSGGNDFHGRYAEQYINDRFQSNNLDEELRKQDDYIRILLVPVLVVALTVETPGGSTIAAVVFAVAALTDGLDGYIARSRQAVTTFGKVMDPVADKLMIAAALIALISLDRLAAWVAMVIIAREFAVSGLRIAAGQQGVVIPASGLGKVKTIVQVVAVLALIAAHDQQRRVGPGARLRDGGGHRRVRRRLLPQLPPPPRAGVTGEGAGRSRPSHGPEARPIGDRAAHRCLRPRRVSRSTIRLCSTYFLIVVGVARREALGELLAAGARAGRARGRRAGRTRRAPRTAGRRVPTVSASRAPASSLARSGHVVEDVRAEGRGAGHVARVVRVRAGHERRLAHPEALERGAHLSVKAQGAQPALGLVLGRVREGHRGTGERDHEGRVLGKGNMSVLDRSCERLRALLRPTSAARADRLMAVVDLTRGSVSPLDRRAVRAPQLSSSHSRMVTWRPLRSPSRRARCVSSAMSPWRSATTLCLWIVSRFSWRAETKAFSPELGVPLGRLRTISRTQSSTKRGRRWAFSTTSTSSDRFISS